ncbi:MAG TPA: hypothetical protein EYF98_15095 [Planctomycetes bacterium]|jgi:hypothetical protein|nr:hypothetical protein [Planctomycetota bacterium]
MDHEYSKDCDEEPCRVCYTVPDDRRPRELDVIQGYPKGSGADAFANDIREWAKNCADAMFDGMVEVAEKHCAETTRDRTPN